MVADIKKIMEVLPHRQPFLLIDQILQCGKYEVGEKVIAKKNVTINEDFFRGHFPNEPVMPGVLIIEALAQTGAYMVLSQKDNKGKIAYFAKLDNAKFKKVVRPGDTLILEMKMLKSKINAGIGEGVAFVNDEVVASGTFTFFIK